MGNVESGAFDAAIGFGGVALGAANLLIAALEFLDIADFSAVGIPMSILLYAYLLLLGGIPILSVRDGGRRGQRIES